MSDQPATATAAASPRPALHVVRGTPDPAELAALVAVLAARSGGGGDDGAASATRRTWNDRSHLVRSALPHGPDAWRRSARRG